MGGNDRCHPFVWTKTADQALKKPTVKQLQIRATTAHYWGRLIYSEGLGGGSSHVPEAIMASVT